jgi:arsenic resistance protein ArsH
LLTDASKNHSNRDRLVDVCEELVKFTLLTKPNRALFDDRWSERKEKEEHGRLRTQAETELARKAAIAVIDVKAI